MMLADTLTLALILGLVGYAGGVTVAYWTVRRRLRNLQKLHQSMLRWGQMTHESMQAGIATKTFPRGTPLVAYPDGTVHEVIVKSEVFCVEEIND